MYGAVYAKYRILSLALNSKRHGHLSVIHSFEFNLSGQRFLNIRDGTGMPSDLSMQILRHDFHTGNGKNLP